MPAVYGRHADKIFKFAPKKDDTWIVTFPKCGTTWTQELVWLLVNNCNKEAAAKINLNTRSPFLEFTYMQSKRFQNLESSLQFLSLIKTSLDQVGAMPDPRVIKTHMPFYLLHPDLLNTSKVVYVARNPKDVIVSYYHHHRLVKLHDFTGNLDQFAQYFMDDKVLSSPFFGHILEAWDKRNHPNMLFLFYEDMKRVFIVQLPNLVNFLNFF